MDERQFWELVGQGRRAGGSSTAQVEADLRRRLATLTSEKIVDFQYWWETAALETYVWPLHDAATLLLGAFDDDGRPFGVGDEPLWPTQPRGERTDLANAELVAERFPRHRE